MCLVGRVSPPIGEGRRTSLEPQTNAIPWPDAATLEERRKSAEPRPLFASAEPLAITIAADFRAIQRDRDPKSEKTFSSSITIPGENGLSTTLQIQVRTRGHSRRLRQTCDFAPLRLEFVKEQARGTVFEGHGLLKLGTHCQLNDRFEQYVLREYTVYRLYNLLTPYSFRARLTRATFVDTTLKRIIDTRYAMFIEDDDDVARRMSGRISDRTGLQFRHVNSDTIVLMTLFEYLIGNTTSRGGSWPIFLMVLRVLSISRRTAGAFSRSRKWHPAPPKSASCSTGANRSQPRRRAASKAFAWQRVVLLM